MGITVDELAQTQFVKRVDSRLKKTAVLTEFKTEIHAIVMELGFSDYHLAPLRKCECIDFTLCSMPKDISEYYTEFELYKHDMLIECMYHDVRPMFQKTVDDHIDEAPYLTEHIAANRDIRKLLHEFQFNDCFVLPIARETAREGQRDEIQKSIGFLALYNRGDSWEKFQRKAKSQAVELSLLADRFYHFGSRNFAELF